MELDHLIQKYRALPKADVHNHLHLGGSQKKLLEKYPNATIRFPEKYNGLSDMIDFIYGHLNKIMVNDKDVINFMEIAIESAIEDNITLLEASVDIGLARFFGNSIGNVIDIVKALKKKYNSKIDFKPDLGVNKDLDLEKVYSDGLKCIESGEFHAIDLYGQEAGKDLIPFVKLYDIAKSNGLRTKVHIGEFSDHQSIDYTITQLRPDELQHGIRAVDSRNTMDTIREQNIRLNICPTSNLLLGAVNLMENHPLRILFDHGINVTINTDDLILFNTTVTEEFAKLEASELFSSDELEIIRNNGFK